MNRHFAKHILLSVAVFLVLFQNLGVATLRLVQGDGFNKTPLICVTPNQYPSAEAIKAAQELMDVLGITETPDTPYHEHCSDCVMSSFNIQNPFNINVPLFFKILLYRTGWNNPAQFAYKAQGPPIGSRAPPSLI